MKVINLPVDLCSSLTLYGLEDMPVYFLVTGCSVRGGGSHLRPEAGTETSVSIMMSSFCPSFKDTES